MAITFAAAVLVSPVHAQHDPPLERGLAADKLYDFGNIDSVDLATGHVTLTLPLGPRFPVGGGLSYGFTLVYNSSVWDFKELGEDPSEPPACYDSANQSWYYCSRLRALPARSSNAGLGWSLSLGRLLDPDDASGNLRPGEWVFIAADGSEHVFANCQGGAEDCPKRYTTDGSHLRLRSDWGPPRRSVEYPDGTSYVFSGIPGQATKWRLAQIVDAHGNRMSVAYSTWEESGQTHERWTVTDSSGSGREHTVELGPNGTVEKLKLASFGSTTTKAVYSFYYTFPTFHRSYNDTDDNPLTGSPDWLNDGTNDVPFLSSVTLPDSNWSLSMPDYYSDRPSDSAGDDTPGIIKKLVLPTGGSLEWTWQRWAYFAYADESKPSCVPSYPEERCTARISYDWSGIASKTARTGSTDGGATWQYFTRVGNDMVEGLAASIPMERRVLVRTPEANDNAYYFIAGPQNFSLGPYQFPVWEYSLPYTRRVSDPAAAERFLSSELFSGTVTDPLAGELSGMKLRQSFVSYGHDDFGTTPVLWVEYRHINRFRTAERTYYLDDAVDGSTGPCTPGGATVPCRFAGVTYDGYDGLGNHRTATTDGSFPGQSIRTSFTGFNPSSGGYPVFVVGEDPAIGSTSVRWPMDKPWILGTYDTQWTQEDTAKVQSEACFDRDGSGFPTDGFLTRTRTLSSSNGARSGNDILAVFTESADDRGNVVTEESYGGDSAGLPTSTHVCSVNLADPTNPKTPGYKLGYAYQNGVRSQSWYVDLSLATPAPFSFKVLDREVDASTGLVKKSCDTAGMCTEYVYDVMARLTRELPPYGHGACVEHAYFRMIDDTDTDKYARVEHMTRKRLDSTSNPCDTASTGYLARASLRFDGLGRPKVEKRWMGSSSWAKRVTEYLGSGWVDRRSEWDNNATAAAGLKWTTFAYDALGRPTTTTPPDGGGHAVVMSYRGARTTNRQAYVKLDETSEKQLTTVETRDRFGRLAGVAEQLDAATTPSWITAVYTYDLGDRLIGVKVDGPGAGDQSRSFVYDNRGFLLGENLPEKTTASGSIYDVEHGGYDARGHATWRRDGSSMLGMAVDKAERLVKVCAGACGSGETLLTQLTYAAANIPATGTPTDWRKGKLVQATAVQPSFTLSAGVTSGTTTVTEALAYKGAGGRVSSRTTTLNIAGSTTGDVTNHAFTQSFAWNELGLPSALGYGTCSSTTPCTGVGDRGVYPTYTAGLLTGVGPYYAQAISYHWSGLPKTITHTRRVLDVANGVTETTGISLATMMARPLSIATSGVTDTAGAVSNWSTGSTAYDGTGNIVSTARDASNLETYRYDGLSRLTSAKRTVAGAPTTQTYVYDDTGNLTSYAGVALATSTATNRLNAATYDAAGNMTGWGGFTYLWDAQNQLVGEKGNLLGRIFAYAADGERLLQRDGSTYTLSLRDLDGKVIRELSLAAGTSGATWTWKKDTVYRSGQILASVAPGEGIRHYHLDHLGTPRQVTNRTGQQVTRHDYWPYGREASLSGNQTPDRMRFTGHERDLNLLNSESDDLDYMHARYYNPTNLGRFLSIDSGVARPSSTQSWNRFAYTRGNPLLRVDPDGSADKVTVFVTFDPTVDFTSNYNMGNLRSDLEKANRGRFELSVFGYDKGTAPTVDGMLSSLSGEGDGTFYLGHAFEKGLGPFQGDTYTTLDGATNNNSLVLLGACDASRFTNSIAPGFESNRAVFSSSGMVRASQVSNFAAVVLDNVGKDSFQKVLRQAILMWKPELHKNLLFMLLGDPTGIGFGRVNRAVATPKENGGTPTPSKQP